MRMTHNSIHRLIHKTITIVLLCAFLLDNSAFASDTLRGLSARQGLAESQMAEDLGSESTGPHAPNHSLFGSSGSGQARSASGNNRFSANSVSGRGPEQNYTSPSNARSPLDGKNRKELRNTRQGLLIRILMKISSCADPHSISFYLPDIIFSFVIFGISAMAALELTGNIYIAVPLASIITRLAFIVWRNHGGEITEFKFEHFSREAMEAVLRDSSEITAEYQEQINSIIEGISASVGRIKEQKTPYGIQLHLKDLEKACDHARAILDKGGFIVIGSVRINGGSLVKKLSKAYDEGTTVLKAYNAVDKKSDPPASPQTQRSSSSATDAAAPAEREAPHAPNHSLLGSSGSGRAKSASGGEKAVVLGLHAGAIERVSRHIYDMKKAVRGTLLIGIDGDKHAFKSSFAKAVATDVGIKYGQKVRVFDSDDYYIESMYMDGAPIQQEGWDWNKLSRDIAEARKSGKFDIVIVHGFELFKLCGNTATKMDEFDLKVQVASDEATRQWIFMGKGYSEEKAQERAREAVQQYPPSLNAGYDFIVDTSIKFWRKVRPAVMELFIEGRGPASITILENGALLPRTGEQDDETIKKLQKGTRNFEAVVTGIHDYAPVSPLISEVKLARSPELEKLFNVSGAISPDGEFYALAADRQPFAVIRFDAATGNCDVLSVDINDVMTGGGLSNGAPFSYWAGRRGRVIRFKLLDAPEDLVSLEVVLSGDNLKAVKLFLKPYPSSAAQKCSKDDNPALVAEAILSAA